MSTAKVTYLGDLRTENVHHRSGASFLTDAPTDNHGKGEAFSPTDTVATALANCMLTVMGIKAKDLGVDLRGATAEVVKVMASQPRRIHRIEISMSLPEGIGQKEQRILENTARNCPVLHSLHPAIEKELLFSWGS